MVNHHEEGLRIITLLKWVPSISEELKIDESGKGIKGEGIAFTLNEFDNYALEEALKLKEEKGGKVTVVSMGSLRCQEALITGLAKGADEAIHILCGLPELDAWATATILSKAISTLEYDMIFVGLEATDSKEGQVGVLIAERLHLLHVSAVTKVEMRGENAIVTRELGGGVLEEIETPLPAVFALMSSKNPPRYASVSRIFAARRRGMKSWELKNISLSKEEIKSRVRIVRLLMPERKRSLKMITGKTKQEIAKNLLDVLSEKGVV